MTGYRDLDRRWFGDWAVRLQISCRIASKARVAGQGEGYSGHSGRVNLAIRMSRRGAPLQAVQTHGRWKSLAMPARYTRGEKAPEATGVAPMNDYHHVPPRSHH